VGSDNPIESHFRLFCRTTVHETLCTTKTELQEADAEATGFHKEKNRRAGRELLGITQRDMSLRPLVCRRAMFGLTGTPLLDSSSRVIERANLMGGVYIVGARILS